MASRKRITLSVNSCVQALSMADNCNHICPNIALLHPP